MLIPSDQEENTGGSKLWKSVQSSIPDTDVSCSSETKHGSMAPRIKLFVSKRRLQKQKSEPRKFVMGSIPSKDGFLQLGY
jgi:hypothetical protein